MWCDDGTDAIVDALDILSGVLRDLGELLSCEKAA